MKGAYWTREQHCLFEDRWITSGKGDKLLTFGIFNLCNFNSSFQLCYKLVASPIFIPTFSTISRTCCFKLGLSAFALTNSSSDKYKYTFFSSTKSDRCVCLQSRTINGAALSQGYALRVGEGRKVVTHIKLAVKRWGFPSSLWLQSHWAVGVTWHLGLLQRALMWPPTQLHQLDG